MPEEGQNMNERFELPAELNIYSTLETRDALLSWVAEQAPKGKEFLEVSARDVQEVDGSGLQLLAALGHGEQRWHLVEASTAFAEACRTMGFSHWLDSRYLKTGASV
jgi:ABC-type transporter Mla MlaB component